MNNATKYPIRCSYFIRVTAIMLVLLILCGCSILQGPAVTTNPTASSTPSATATKTSEPTALPSDETSPAALDPIGDVDTLLESMTLEEKVGQMFFIATRYNAAGDKMLDVDEALASILNQYKPGGFIFFAENLDSISQTVTFINNLQKNSDIPLFVSIDEEGGIVTRLNKADKLHSTVMPDPYTIEKTKDPQYAFQVSKAIAEEIRSLGFNMNFAPVADVFSNPENKIIGKRAYGSDPRLVSEMVAEAVKGAYDGGIVPVLKHFPGHGDTLQDSHTGAAIVENDIDRLRKVEFMPFKAGIQAGAEVVMTAHVLTPNVTQSGLPATLSKPILQGLLREELGFDGLIITDGLEMSAISAFYPEEEAVVLAIEAGVDMLLLPKDFELAFKAVLSAVYEGKLTQERIDESVRRILSLKNTKLSNQASSHLDAEETLGSKQHQELVKEIKEKSSKQ